jgi:pyridoxal 5'-phosphate synthase pdxS subunit
MKKKIFSMFILISALVSLISCGTYIEEKSFNAMGTVITVQLYEKSKGAFEGVKDIFSLYSQLTSSHRRNEVDENSPYYNLNNIYVINENRKVGPIEVREELIELLELSIGLNEETNGYFNIGLGEVPADIRKDGGIARMSDPKLIKAIRDNIDIPIMAKVRIGHFTEAQILEALDIDFIDESEVLTRADYMYHIDKKAFETPFVCGAKNLGEALRRINEGALMIRTKGEAGTGDVSQAVNHIRTITNEIKNLKHLSGFAEKENVPLELVKNVKDSGRLPVLNFAAGGIATPADAALMMQLGCDGIFVGSGIFKSSNPAKMAKAIVDATKHYNDNKKLAEISEGLGAAMSGIDLAK